MLGLNAPADLADVMGGVKQVIEAVQISYRGIVVQITLDGIDHRLAGGQTGVGIW